MILHFIAFKYKKKKKMTHADRVFVRVNINLMQKQRKIQMYVDL